MQNAIRIAPKPNLLCLFLNSLQVRCKRYIPFTKKTTAFAMTKIVLVD